MIVIVVAQGKGGVGKTTVAVNLAGDIVRYGRTVTLIDADPQASATEWAEPRRLGFPVRQDVMTLRNQLVWVRDVLKTPSDFILIDLPAGFGPVFDTSVLIADLLAVPCGPSSIDINAAQRTIAKAREIRRCDPPASGLKIATVPTRVDPDHEEGTQIIEALADLGEPVAPSLSYHIDFVRSFTSGTTVSALGERATAAADVKRLSFFLLRQVLPRHDPLAI